MNKNEVGRVGEKLAAEYLSVRGYTILDRNWRPPGGAGRQSGERQNLGELDLVAMQGATLVGVEVKTRTTLAFGHPAASLTRQKVGRLKGLLGQWIAAHKGGPPQFKELRLDAVAIVLEPLPQVTHLVGIS